jgi:phage terminase large subunit-like protein
MNEWLAHPLGGYRPVPAAMAFHRSKAKNRWVLGGNRSGKSEAMAVEILLLALDRHPYFYYGKPIEVCYATDAFEMVGKILYSKVKRLLGNIKYEVVWQHRGKQVPDVVRVPSISGGWSTIHFKAYQQGRAKFQGTEYDLVGFDEQWDDQGIYEEVVSRLGGGRELRFMASMTPIKPQAWLERKLSEKLPDNTEKFEYNLNDNRISRGGFIADAEVDAAIDEWPVEVRDTRISGKWGSYSGSIFQSFNREIHVVGKEREKQFFRDGKPYFLWPTYAGIDFGGANPFVCLLATRIPHMDNAWYVYDEYYWASKQAGQRMLSEHATAIKTMADKWNARLITCYADHDNQDQFELRRYDLPVELAKKDVLGGIDLLRSMFQVRKDTNRPRLFIAERCKMTISEVASYRWSDGSKTKDSKEAPLGKDDHSVDALRYIVHTYEKQNPESENQVYDFSAL